MVPCPERKSNITPTEKKKKRVRSSYTYQESKGMVICQPRRRSEKSQPSKTSVSDFSSRTLSFCGFWEFLGFYGSLNQLGQDTRCTVGGSLESSVRLVSFILH